MPPPDPRSFAANVLRASFEGVEFPVADAETTTSHDGIGHKAYLVPGADFEPTGLNEETGSLVVPLFNGVDGMENLYPETWKRLLSAIRLNPIGTLVHPTRGTMRVFLSLAKEAFTAGPMDGVVLHLQWSEHNGNSTDATTDPTQALTTQSAAACQLAAERVDAEIVALGNPLLLGFLIAEFIGEQFAQLDSVLQTAGSIRAAFALMDDRVAELRDFPEFRVALGFGVANALSGLGVTLLSTMNVYLPGLNTATALTTSVTKTIWEVAEDVYGDVSGVTALLDANTIVDPLAIPPGTVLTVPPWASDGA